MQAPAVFQEHFSVSGILLVVYALIGVVALAYTMPGMNRRTAMPFTIEAVNPLARAAEIVLKPVDEMLKFRVKAGLNRIPDGTKRKQFSRTK